MTSPDAGDSEPATPTAAAGDEPPLPVGSWRARQRLEYHEQQMLMVQAERGPAYGAAVLVITLVVGALVYFAMRQPVQHLAGTARPVTELPPAPTATSNPEPPPPPATTSSAPASTPPADARAALARHPLSTSDATLGTTVCALTRFDPADERQAKFFQEAKICADAVWGGALTAAGLPTLPIQLVTVQGGPASTQCGPVNPTDRPTQCRATVYMTPAHLRDVEHDDRYPGRYFGVFLREYARAVQEATGLTALQAVARKQPGAAPADLDTRLAQQATCLAGAAAGAMAGQGAVDANITNEIRDRLSTVDAPPDAAAWLAKGFQSKSFAACNTWAN
ncbi:MAG TPA: hypothetical protein VGR06_00280 [Actinophytocola sp.]|jgi:predicted metalloprotease|uniref:hypothetical protein n=1 Tax=Actinophytocola sp. TaxID=1872138 RepID=UPI002DFC59A1|nr:hypothetical protein [Actinophytocola sp.]